jgi:hypothetical protein
MGKIKGAYRVLVGEPEGKKLLGRPMRRKRIKLTWIFKTWYGRMDSIGLA